MGSRTEISIYRSTRWKDTQMGFSEIKAVRKRRTRVFKSKEEKGRRTT